MTKIPWTEKTWNPLIGCTKIAEGCKNCYAERMAKRLYHMGIAELWKFPEYMNFEDGWKGGHVELCEHRLEEPLHWRKPRKIFVCSMSDLFHPKVPFAFIDKVMAVIALCPQHTIQILTKRIERAAEYFESVKNLEVESKRDMIIWDAWRAVYGEKLNDKIWPLPNIWIGTSISTQADADRNIPILLQIPATVRMVSIEPMLESVDITDYVRSGGSAYKILSRHYGKDGFDPKGGQPERTKPRLDWVIIGCESGPKARLCSADDILDAVRQCREAGVPVFVKQVPINGKCSKNPDEWPEDLRVQEYPRTNNG